MTRPRVRFVNFLRFKAEIKVEYVNCRISINARRSGVYQGNVAFYELLVNIWENDINLEVL